MENIIPHPPIAAAIMEVAHTLGDLFVKDNPKYQKRLLNLIMATRTTRSVESQRDFHQNMIYLLDCFTPMALFSQDRYVVIIIDH